MLDATFKTIPLAHRGLHDMVHGRPENSRASIRLAIERGYGIEIDLQLSADGEAVVFHDYQLDRLTNEHGPVRQRDLRALKKISLKGGDETIPTFSEVLELVNGQVPLLVELKDQDGAMGHNVGQLEKSVCRSVVGYDGALAFMSFNPHSVDALLQGAPNIPRGLVTDAYAAADWPLLNVAAREQLRAIPDYVRLQASFVSHSVKDLDAPRVTELKQGGAVVLCWTVRDEDTAQQALEVADNITFEGYFPTLSSLSLS